MSERRISQLPEQLANQIAAGEVVARPASVVKELVDNAVDAGARHLRVEVDGGGITRLRVVDDGHGIHPDDVPLTLARHATSKIGHIDDLRTIATMGFRGEALASIASVSKLLLQTRRNSDDEGTEMRVEGGREPTIRPCGCGAGTIVEVSDLFYNVPARRKFLRAVATESAHVSDAVRNAALAHPSVQLELVRDGRSAKRWRGVPDLQQRVADVLSDYELWSCAGERGPVTIRAFLADPARARSGAGGLHLFINSRPIQDRGLARAVAQAYGATLEPDRYPVGAVYVAMPAELVDVNVHPQKAEVRFAHARAVTDAVYSVLSRALAERLPTPPEAARRPRAADEVTQSWQWSDSGQAALPTRPIAAHPTTAAVVSLFRQRFAVCERGDRLLIIDTRRLLQRRRLEQATQQLARGALASQRLLFPARHEVDARAADAVEAASSQLERFGFDLRRSGERAVTIHAAARIVAGCAAERLLDAIVDALVAGSELESLLGELVAQALASEPPPSLAEVSALIDTLDDAALADAVTMAITSDELLRRAGAP